MVLIPLFQHSTPTLDYNEEIVRKGSIRIVTIEIVVEASIVVILKA